MALRRGSRLVIHVTLDDSLKGRSQSIEDAISQTCTLKACLERYRQGWERPSADEAVWVATTASNRRIDSTLDWVEELRDDIHRTAQMGASVGIASTRLAARIASRVARPRGLLLLLPGYEKGFIASVSLEELDELRPEQAAALRRRGIRTLGELGHLDLKEARSFLGPGARQLIGLVRGIEGRTERARGSRLERAARILCRRAAKRLRDGRLGARGLELCLFYRDGFSLERYTLMPRPVHSSWELEASATKILRWFPTRQEPVVGMSLTATGIGPCPGQLPLFARPKEVKVHLGSV